MYPLPVVVAGCGERVLPHVRRELLNHAADVQAEFGTIPEVVRHRDDFRGDARLFLVQVQSPQDLQDMKHLSRTFVGQPVLAVTDTCKDVGSVIAAMRAGAAQVVTLPLQADDFASALDCIGSQFGNATGRAKLIAVSGVTGGCGATTLALNLAYELAQQYQQRTILTELSMQMGMLTAFLDIKTEYTLGDLLSYGPGLDLDVVKKSLTPFADKFSVLAGAGRPIAPSPEAAARVTEIVEYLRQLTDVVVLDVPCTFDDGYFDLLGSADQVVLVSEQRIPSVRNAQLVLNSLGPELAGRSHLVVNRYDPRMEGFTVSELEKLLEHKNVKSVANDPTRVTAAVNQGRPLRLAAPQSPALADVSALARMVLGLNTPPVAEAAHSTVFGRMFHAFGLT